MIETVLLILGSAFLGGGLTLAVIYWLAVKGINL